MSKTDDARQCAALTSSGWRCSRKDTTPLQEIPLCGQHNKMSETGGVALVLDEEFDAPYEYR